MHDDVRWVDPLAEPGTMAAIERLACTAYGVSSFANNYLVQVAAQPDGIAVIERDGEPVASACFVVYPDGGFGWIGMVATDPDHGRGGLGTIVTEAVAQAIVARGCRPVLDASAAGFKVYERMGFVDVAGLHVLQRITTEASADREVVMLPGPTAAVLEFDRACFGADRSAVVAAVTGNFPSWVCGDPDQPEGWAARQDGRIGPVVADDPAVARALIATALRDARAAGHEQIQMYVPDRAAALGWLADDGWACLRSLRHMHRHPEALPGRRSALVAQVSPGVG